MAKTISPTELAGEVNAILEQFKETTETALKDATDMAVKDIVTQLKEKSPKQPGGGEYAKSWAATPNQVKKGEAGYGRIVYNKKHYRLTHLLEYGHAKVGRKGGRTKAIPHIKPAEEAGIANFERRLLEDLK